MPASLLRHTLLGDVAVKVELGGTRNPVAFAAYLRGAKAVSARHDTKDLPTAGSSRPAVDRHECQLSGTNPPEAEQSLL
jgi:hypothetical protein